MNYNEEYWEDCHKCGSPFLGGGYLCPHCAMDEVDEWYKEVDKQRKLRQQKDCQEE